MIIMERYANGTSKRYFARLLFLLMLVNVRMTLQNGLCLFGDVVLIDGS